MPGTLLRDARGLALTEFALVFPMLLLIGAWGIEMANYTIVHLRVSQYALTLADNASRAGITDGSSTVKQMREGDINDILQGTWLSSGGIGLGKNGRVILSSLENLQQSDGTYAQRLHWQRCFGKNAAADYQSSYGTTTTTSGTNTDPANAGTAMPDGMGDPDYMVKAPQGSGVMFVEINYLYQPLFGTMLIPSQRVHYTASFIVRVNRDYSFVSNVTPKVTASTCDRYEETVPI